MRDHIFFFLNGQAMRASGREVFAMLAPWIRARGLTGTKIACAHGACGSCSVLIGRAGAGGFDYQPLNACILPVFACDGAHIISVEGLNGSASVGGQDDGVLSPVQRAMMDCHGAQCGFCTPGIVVALTAFHQQKHAPSADLKNAVQSALEGNLCRCTGYAPIIDAGISVEIAALKPLSTLYDADSLRAELDAAAAADVEISVAADALQGAQQLFLPRSMDEAARCKAAHPEAVVVAGATEIGVAMSVHGLAPRQILSLARVEECDEVGTENGTLILGGRASWTSVARQINEIVPEFAQLLSRWGSPQLRHAGTVAGSIMGASAISDSLPFLLICGAELEFLGASGARRVTVADFLENGAKAHSGELLRRVLVPLPDSNQKLRLYKVSKRRAFDRSIVSAALLLTARDGRIEAIKIACGGVAPTVVRLPQTEKWLQNQLLDSATWREAGRVAQNEISPASDAAASRHYRLQLVAGLLRRFGGEI